MNLDNLLGVKKLNIGLEDVFRRTEKKYQSRSIMIRVDLIKVQDVKDNLLSQIFSALFFKIDPNNIIDSVFNHEAQLNNSMTPKLIVDASSPIRVYLHTKNQQFLLYQGLMGQDYYKATDMKFNLELIFNNVKESFFYLEVVGLKVPTQNHLDEIDIDSSKLITQLQQDLNGAIDDPKILDLVNLRNNPFKNIFHFYDYLFFMVQLMSKHHQPDFEALTEKSLKDLKKIQNRLDSDLKKEYTFKARQICQRYR